ncbi:MAG: non-hydrolyzing UDP-N-acetylglucosamine 2-epimerase [Geminicoccaceae bacterium]
MRLVTVVGARPQFVKAAVVARALAKRDEIDHKLIHTGQHFDQRMSAQFFEELAIPEPDHNLSISGGHHGQMTGRMMEGIEQVLLEDRPDAVLVYGDTNSTLAGALAATKMHIPVYHVEAGLRSFNRRMPEEVNRVLTDHVSTLLFCPTTTSVDNLRAEGIEDGVRLIGDVMFDATIFAKGLARERSTIVDEAGLTDGAYVLLTLHRAENTDDSERLAALCRFIEKEAKGRPVVFPVHPRTRQAFARHGLKPADATMIEPVGYVDMHRLLAGAALVMTDSGGLQKEAYFHRVPCLTLRDETEWVETVEAGWNRLWSAEDYLPRRDIDAYGDGTAGEKIVQVIEEAHSLDEGRSAA